MSGVGLGADGRRRALVAAGGAWLLGVTPLPVSASPETLAAAIAAVTGGKPLQDGGLVLELPRIADDGNVVAMTVRADSPQTAEDHVRVLHVFSEQNPVTALARFHLGPVCPRAEVGTRIRLARTQRVVAVAEMSDGSFRSAVAQVEVTISACGD
ncbi:MAG: thiosulfate oxidation carrier protein SoxY [Betaproteobacteria bacterium]